MAHAPPHCPVGDCLAAVHPEQLMCPRHWRLVPSPLKRACIARGKAAPAPAARSTGRRCAPASTRRRQAASRASDQNLRQMVRRFLAGYRHPNHINGESWDEEDVTRLIRVMRCHPHKPDPRTRRCRLCGAVLGS